VTPSTTPSELKGTAPRLAVPLPRLDNRPGPLLAPLQGLDPRGARCRAIRLQAQRAGNLVAAPALPGNHQRRSSMVRPATRYPACWQPEHARALARRSAALPPHQARWLAGRLAYALANLARDSCDPHLDELAALAARLAVALTAESAP
jgi:hypothetical protein